MKGLKNKTAIVTGGGLGIGAAGAIEFAKEGVSVAIMDVNETAASLTASIIEDRGGTSIVVLGDASSSADCERTVHETVTAFGGLDILFNNAGISPTASGFWSISDKDYTTSFAVNTLAPILMCKRILPKMIKRGYGRVINVTSSIQKRPAEMAYACSKAALDKFVHDLAPSLNDTGVMLSLLDLGWLKTDMGGEKAYHAVETVLPGALIPAIINDDINGRWISAQDYSGLDINTAIQKAKLILSV